MAYFVNPNTVLKGLHYLFYILLPTLRSLVAVLKEKLNVNGITLYHLKTLQNHSGLVRQIYKE